MSVRTALKAKYMNVCHLVLIINMTSVLPSLIDRLGDSKDQVREQDQALLLKIMDQAANPQVKPPPPVSLSAGGSNADRRSCFTVFPVCVGANDGRLQTQEQPEPRGSLLVPRVHPQRVSHTDTPLRRPLNTHAGYEWH